MKDYINENSLISFAICTFNWNTNFQMEQEQMSQSVQVRLSEMIQIMGIEQIQDTYICQVNSYSSTTDGNFLIICTQTGIFIVNNPLFTYKCYLNKNGPFWIENKNMAEVGVKMGSLVQSRNQAAVVPNFTNKYFKKTHVYIFDYEMKCILHSIDFFLSIDYLRITPEQIFVSNKKRLLVYNYLNDSEHKNQKYYLDQYLSKKPNDKLRYLETYCEEYEDPFTMNEIMQLKQQNCLCGKFFLSSRKPLIAAYLQTFQKEKKRKICIYNQKFDTTKYFEENLNIQNFFEMTVSPDGEFLAYTTNDGRNINVYNLKENRLHCVLYVSRRLCQTLKMEMFIAQIEGVTQLCLGVIRNTNASTATLHIFIIQSKPPTETISSKYKRYFPLYENIFKNYGISETFINPGIFLNNNVLYVYSICGRVFQVIDFTRTGNPAEKTFDAKAFHKKWICEDDINS